MTRTLMKASLLIFGKTQKERIMKTLMKTSLLIFAIPGCVILFMVPFDHAVTPTGGWTVQPTAGLSRPRAAHKVTVISSNSVLVTGGCSGVGCSPVERSAELLYLNKATSVVTQPMHVPRVSHVAALLKDGRVLVAGGWTGDATTSSAEIFDPPTRSFLPTKPMATPRMDATATSLPDGSVLIVGGATATNHPVRQAEVFDQEKGQFIPAGLMHEARAHHAAVRLNDGRVLVVGGQRGRNQATSSAEIFDPGTRTFTVTGSMRQARCKHGAVLLKDGRVMVIGGSNDCDERSRIAQTEIFDPRTGQFSSGPALLTPRYKIVDAATVLPSGEVVVAGDANDVEVWTPGMSTFTRASGRIGSRLAFSSAVLLPNSTVLVSGGYDNDIRPTAQAWLVRRINTGSRN
ncbi:MAG TPA: kelch repeat-containing protein [Blastocatellia bacterium]|nr:kelch repeat-containing protein [Blastocatellia bacterium]